VPISACRSGSETISFQRASERWLLFKTELRNQSMNRTAKILLGICESQPVTAEGLRTLVETSGRYDVLPTVGTLEEASRLVTTDAPQLLLLDKAVGLPAVMEWLGRSSRTMTTRVVIWGASLSESEALRMLKSGAQGVLRKTAGLDQILACLDSVASGTTWMEEALFREGGRPVFHARTDLTAREQQVLDLVEQGLRNKEIARELGIQPGTVKIHLKHIFEKTGIRGRYGLALSGLRDKGLIGAYGSDDASFAA
jgi:DNA-binding NarL/FixJ family response regulator